MKRGRVMRPLILFSNADNYYKSKEETLDVRIQIKFQAISLLFNG